MNKKGKESSEEMVDNKIEERDEVPVVTDEDPIDESNEESLSGEPEGNDIAEKTAKELQDLKDKYLRLAAEFDNYRKRTAKENLEIRMTASRDLMTSLLEILDDVDRAEVQINEVKQEDKLLEGVKHIFNKFRKTLEQKGLKAIETLHTDFDVEKDEAISEMPVDDEKMKGKVVAEVQKGYMLNDRLIRFAKVVVGK